ncbi:sensor histidine kinase [Nesterenkonia ebinurensis]|uniref:sensor histidine kinase n=1 Tax=Nesterenkonia ebinurensis TaxID=2608252 RepID=UPI001CC38907|nr:sensor histidine kinase [Nesterenkonia ebinurensis]
MTEQDAGAAAVPRSALRRTGANAIYLTTGGLLLSAPAAGGFAMASTIIAAVMISSPYTDLAPEDIAPARVSLILLTCLIGLATITLCFFFGRLHRSRAAALLGVHIPIPRSPRGWRRLLTLGFTPYGLRMLAYHLIGLLWGPVMVAVVLICLVGGPGLVVFGLNLTGDLPMTDILLVTDVLLALGGAGLLLVSPWILRGVAVADLALVRWVNGVTEKAVLAQRVQQVTEARSGVVAAADAERRRIERNLHDGAQQRLTALAVHLGIERSRHAQAAAAGETLEAQETAAALKDAQTEVQTALQEIRHLVRGLHPAVLEDRGLDAAVSGIASRAPFPVAVRVDVPERPILEVEAVAYFVVSEAMNNVIAHAEAEHASVTVQRTRDSLEIAIDDDGAGGADEQSGTGLTGLRQRVESVDGTLRMVSEPGQGTQIRVELPCA